MTFRSAFTPLYGNQYSGQQSNQYWPNSSYHSSSAGNTVGIPTSLLNKHGNNDVDGSLNNRKEKRQYKKRKHKNQREKQASGKNQIRYTKICFVVVDSPTMCERNVIMYELKRNYVCFVIISGSTIDHLASSDEDEPIINLNHLGHDTENEGLYPFRRNGSNQYHRVCNHYLHRLPLFQSSILID